MLRKLFALTAAAVSFAASGFAAQAQTPTELNFGIISTEASVNQKKIWEPFLQAMAKSTGYKINGFYATDYAGVIEAMRFGKVQVARYGNKSGMEAVDRSSGAGLRPSGRNRRQHRLLLPHHRQPGQSLRHDRRHLQMRQVARFRHRRSGTRPRASWCRPPIFSLPSNIDPKSCFKTVRNANHQANAMAVANKQVAAATNNSEDLQRLMVTAPQAREQIKIIWTSPIIPLDPIVWRKDLDPAIKAKLYTFMLSYGRVGSPDEIKTAKEMIAGMIWSPLRPSSDDQLLPMRKLEASKSAAAGAE